MTALRCPHCGVPFQLPAVYPASGQVACPGCKKPLRLPPARPPVPAAPAAPRAPAVAPVRAVRPVAPIDGVAHAPLPAALRRLVRLAPPPVPTARLAPHAKLARESVEVVPIDARWATAPSPAGSQPPRRPAPTGRHEPRFTSAPTAAPRRLPTNHAAVVTAVIAGLAAIGWLTSLVGLFDACR